MSSSGQNGKPGDTGREVAFFGKITASVTHELNNVISIIDQTAGLLDDLIAGEEQGMPISVDRLISVSAAIQKQTQRGLGIIERLNRFAHSTDYVETQFELGDVLGNLVELCQRLASLKKSRIEYTPHTSAVKTTGNPFAMQQAVFVAFQWVLMQLRPDTAISLEGQASTDGVEIVIGFDCGSADDTASADQLTEAAKQLGASVAVESAGDNVTLRLTIPMQAAQQRYKM